MHILVTNDDGYRAEGISTLAKYLSKEYKVTMVAPDSEQSGVGHGFTFLRPLMSRRVDREIGLEKIKAYAVDGTPVDCVKLGRFLLGDDKPDFIVSGINHGANLGTDVMYSGTASAATEGTILGIPSLAVSCASNEASHFDTAAKVASKVVKYMIKNPLPEHLMLNLNVPDCKYEDVKGIMIAPLAIRRYFNAYEFRTDPRGRNYYWLADSLEKCLDESSDEAWVSDKYASLTPVELDRTDNILLEKMKSYDFEL